MKIKFNKQSLETKPFFGWNSLDTLKLKARIYILRVEIQIKIQSGKILIRESDRMIKATSRKNMSFIKFASSVMF